MSNTYKILTILLFIASCSPERPSININDIDLNVKIKRLDTALFTIPSDLTNNDIEMIKSDFGLFYSLFVRNIISVGKAEDSVTLYYLNHFRNDPTVKEIVTKTSTSTSSLSIINSAL